MLDSVSWPLFSDADVPDWVTPRGSDRPHDCSLGGSMIRSSLFVVPVLSLLFACGSSDSSTPSTTSDAGSTPTERVDGGDGGSSAAALPFKPSNIVLDGIDLSKLGDLVVDRADCSIDSGTKEVGCGDSDNVAYALVDQPGAGKIGVYVAKSVRIEPNASLRAKGTYALAIVALGDFDVQGGVDVGARTSYTAPGGFAHPTGDNSKGNGPGGGGAGASTNAGGGGGYCDVGGKGAATASGTAVAGGPAYGTPENVPLVGGSAGGAGTLPFSGTGGGAVQLVSGATFTLGANGWVTAGGGGGAPGGVPQSQHGSGGGSGGAILIEAPTVTLLGTVAANGGAGGSSQPGKDGMPEALPATSEAATNGTHGGVGSSQESFVGGDGEWFTGDAAGGGGGGAGRIRINSENGNSALTAKVLSPSANGPCTTQGTLTR